MTKIIAIIQARVSSSRLPGKALKPILGKPMLAHQIRRILQSHRIDQLAIATSTDPSDDDLEDLCRQMNIPCFRGSLNDVLDRFYQGAIIWHPQHVVRLTGDCPTNRSGNHRCRHRFLFSRRLRLCLKRRSAHFPGRLGRGSFSIFHS